MPNPFFTVIIPTFNRADRIRKAIDSVIAQTFPDFELIVVDDGSTDNTPEVVGGIHDARITYWQTPNRERAAARNTGVSKSKGAYVTFLDSDDFFYPEHLSNANRSLQLDRPELYHQAYEVVDENGVALFPYGHLGPIINDLLFTRGNVMSCLGVFVRGDVAKANPFDETPALTGVEDWELWIRLAARYDIHHGSTVSAALVQHSGRSVSRVDGARWIERMDAFLRIVDQNKAVQEKYAALLPKLRANAATYLSLHLSESASFKKEAVKFLFRGISHSGSVLFTRRTLAILRNLLAR